MSGTKRSVATSLGLVLMAGFAAGEVGRGGPELARAKAQASPAAQETEAARPVSGDRYGAPAETPEKAAETPSPLERAARAGGATVWVPGRFEAVTTTVLEPQEQREVWIPPLFRTGYDYAACRPTREMVRAGRWDYVREPGRLTQRETMQWSGGYEQPLGAQVARGSLDAPAPAPAPVPTTPVAEPAPVAAPSQERKPSKPGFDLSAGWAVAPAPSERR